nr:hypothetical protein [Tanacetum cinerariifolium]
ENSTFDGKCKRSVNAIDSQLGNQHKNRQYRMHVIYKKFPTNKEVLVDPRSGIELSDWVKLCDKFASEKFQMLSEQNKNRSFDLISPVVGTKSVARRIDIVSRRQRKNVTAIDNYETAHYYEKKKTVSEEAVAVLENSTFDGKCKRSVNAIDSQLGNQHKNRQYRMHVIYKKFPTNKEVLVDPRSGIELSDWVKLCDKFASEKFQMLSEQNKNRSFDLISPVVGTKSVARRIDIVSRRQRKNVTAIDNYETAHYYEKKKTVSEEAVAVLVCSTTMYFV